MIKKLISCVLIMLMLFSTFSNLAFGATEISEAYIESNGDCRNSFTILE